MYHSFHISLAEKFGVEAATIINNFDFWLTKNRADERHFYDGKYWTYNSAKGLSEIFPYINPNKMWRLIDRLREVGVLQTGNYNKAGNDRTMWYTFTDTFLKEWGSILQFCKMDFANLENAFCKSAKPLPVINPDSKPDKKSPKQFIPPTLEEITEYCKERNSPVNPEKLFQHYEGTGWTYADGKKKVKDWKKCVITWEQNAKRFQEQQPKTAVPYDEVAKIMGLRGG